METIDFRLQTKSLDESGIFTGFASTYDNTDFAGDRVVRGAFEKTLRDRGHEIPLLFNHDVARPVGLGRLTDTQKGLQIDGKLTLDAPDGRTAYCLMRDGVIKGLSIGFKVVRDDFKNGIRMLKEVQLFEVSLTALPLNEQARITAVKTVDDALPQLKSLFERYRIPKGL